MSKSVKIANFFIRSRSMSSHLETFKQFKLHTNIERKHFLRDLNLCSTKSWVMPLCGYFVKEAHLFIHRKDGYFSELVNRNTYFVRKLDTQIVRWMMIVSLFVWTLQFGQSITIQKRETQGSSHLNFHVIFPIPNSLVNFQIINITNRLLTVL